MMGAFASRTRLVYAPEHANALLGVYPLSPPSARQPRRGRTCLAWRRTDHGVQVDRPSRGECALSPACNSVVSDCHGKQRTTERQALKRALETTVVGGQRCGALQPLEAPDSYGPTDPHSTSVHLSACHGTGRTP